MPRRDEPVHDGDGKWQSEGEAGQPWPWCVGDVQIVGLREGDAPHRDESGEGAGHGADSDDDDALPERDAAAETLRCADRGEGGVVGSSFVAGESECHAGGAEYEHAGGADDEPQPGRGVGWSVLHAEGRDHRLLENGCATFSARASSDFWVGGSSYAPMMVTGTVGMPSFAAVSGEMMTLNA